MKSIEAPNRDVTKMPVIGKLITKSVCFDGYVMPSDKYDIVAVVENDTIYVTSKYYKPGVPLLIHKDLVETYTPTK